MSRRSPRRAVRALLVLVVVCLIALLAVDQVVRSKAQTQFSGQVSAQLGTQDPVGVKIRDWPFLLSLARDRIGTADLSVGPTTLRSGSREVAVQSAQIRVRGLTPMRAPSSASVSSADASVVIDWATLSRLTGVQLSLAGDNRVGAVTSFSVFGTQVQASIVAALTLSDPSGQLSLVDPSAQLAGVQVPSEIVSGAAARLKSRLVLPALPEGISYSGVSVDSRGATVRVHAGHLQLSQLR